MAGSALDVACIQRVVNTCWLSKSLGQLPASALSEKGERAEIYRGKKRERRGKDTACVCVCVEGEERESVPSQTSSVPSHS